MADMMLWLINDTWAKLKNVNVKIKETSMNN